MVKRHGFSLAELAFALVAVSGLVAVLVFQLSSAQVRTQDRTVEQGLAQMAADATRQASYGEGVLTLAGFSETLALPTTPEMFSSVLDGSLSEPGVGVGPSQQVGEVSVLVADDGSVAFLAARTFSGRCVLASVTMTGVVLVSRPLDLSVCLPRSDFSAGQQIDTFAPAWEASFTPLVDALPGQARVGWSTSGLAPLAEGAPPVSLYVASAQRISGGVVRSCSVFVDLAEPAQVAGEQVEFSCIIADLTPSVEYLVRVTAYSDAGMSPPSGPASVTPLPVVADVIDGEATTGQVVIEWDAVGVDQ